MQNRIVRSSALVVALALSHISGFGQKDLAVTTQPDSRAIQNTARAITPRSEIRGEIAPAETQSFQFEITSGQYARIAINPHGAPLKVTIVGPDAKVIFDQTLPEGTLDSERISIIAEASGSCVLTLAVPANRKTATRFVLEVEDLRASIATDQKRVQAERLDVEARLAIARRNADGLRTALQKYGESLKIWTELNEQRRQAEVLLSTGRILHNLSRPKEALDYYTKSLELWHSIGDRRKEAETLSATGWAYTNLGDPEKALVYYLQALPIRREANDLRGQAQTLTTIGQSYALIGKPQNAIDYYTLSLPLARQANDKIQEAFALTSFALLYAQIDEYQKALEHIDLALPLWVETGQRFGEADALNTKGTIYSRLGDSDKAISYYERSIELSKVLGNRSLEADALSNMGVEHWRMARYRDRALLLQKSIEYLNRALEIRRAMGQKVQMAQSLNNLGLTYQYLGEADKGLEYFRQVIEVDGRHSSAIHNIGLTHYLRKEYAKAIEFCSEGLVKFREEGDRIGEASALRTIGMSQMQLGNLDDALSKIEEALSIIESRRLRTVGNEVRISFELDNESYSSSELMILERIHRQRPSAGYDIKALEAAESARQRGLLDLLREAHVDIREGADPALLNREKILERELNSKEQYRMRLTAAKAPAEKITVLEKEIGFLITEYQELRDRIRLASPHYASLTHPAPLSSKQIQQLLDTDTLILDYWITGTGSYLWLVSPSSVSMYSLPNGRILGQAERRLYKVLTARNQHPTDETPDQRTARLAKADLEYRDAAATVSQNMLGPVAAELGHKRLVVIGAPDTPFDVLPSPRQNGKPAGHSGPDSRDAQREFRPLIVDHEIVHIPSASVLAQLRRDAASRPSSASGVAIFADPVFATDDPRVKIPELATSRNSLPAAARSSSSAVAQNGIDPRAAMFRRLRFSREEADAIAEMANRSKTFEAVDFAANKETLKQDLFTRRSIIHFATHTILNSERPDLSGIVLSLVDESGNPLDGFLRLHEIYNLKLNSNLVVLSSCNSAFGGGDDANFVGLTTGFMYAGTPRVVASLWSVDDRATAELMKRFYKAMLVDGMRPAAALRAAQIQMLGEKGWESPYFWGAFTLQGEWR